MEKTDLERFVELYRGFGIECKINVIQGLEGSSAAQNLNEITIISPDYTKFYSNTDTFSNKLRGGYTRLLFDSNGKFKEQGAWG